MNANHQAIHARRLELAHAGMFEMKRGAVWVPITKKDAQAELKAGRTVYRYSAQRGPVEVVELY